MRKVSEIIKSQASTEFKQKRQQVILSTLEKHKHKENFQDILNLYLYN